VLIGDHWSDGFLDYWGERDEYAVEVLAWKCVSSISGLYFERRYDWRLVWNYVRELGPVAVLNKYRSRRAERERNRKYISCGIGRVAAGGPRSGRLREGEMVLFIAPCHPRCVDRLPIPGRLLAPWRGPRMTFDSGSIAFLPEHRGGTDASELLRLAGWSPAAGELLARPDCADALNEAAGLLERACWNEARQLPKASGVPLSHDRCGESRERPGRVRGVLVGYGNYAKTVLVPNVRAFVQIACVHELDPLQVSRDAAPWAWCTAPFPQGRYDVHFVAGYHHTHADLAVAALEQGAYAVVEKPIAITGAQLARLYDAASRNPRLFSCYQRRYSRWNNVAAQDLDVRPGDPISYHCIVYEVPLPPKHWYRWPVSGSRVVSNGCHWIDHFLFLNGFAAVKSASARVSDDDTAFVTVDLQNGATFSMALTEVGSDRIGVQDYIQLRSGGATVEIVNDSRYRSENRRRVIRTARANRMESYETMYRSIARQISLGADGDPVASLTCSAGAILHVEELIQDLMPKQGGCAMSARPPGGVHATTHA
jgi:predicted dehydrogenase